MTRVGSNVVMGGGAFAAPPVDAAAEGDGVQLPTPAPAAPGSAHAPTALKVGGIALTGAGMLGVLGSLGMHSLHARGSNIALFGGLAAALTGLGALTTWRAVEDRRNPHVPSAALLGGGPAPSDAKAPTTTVTGVSGPEGASLAAPSFSLKTVAEGLGQLVQVTNAPGDQGLWLVEKSGKLLHRGADGAVETRLDITSLVSSGGEQGLLSVAFHPAFATNGRLFVNYTDKDGDTHVAEGTAGRGGAVDKASLKDLMVIDQPYANHNGGQLQFGPDGMLYIGMGDGGGGGDPEERAQDLGQHLGKLLRIDVDHPSASKPYGVPKDNPFVGTAGAKPEIYSTGVRNPWRFSFDSKTGDLWMGDVGQSTWEEVDFVPRGQARGANFGWDVREGAHAFEQSAQAPGPVIDPVLEYSHQEGSSITGGYVYRGNAIPSLQGYYLYADIAKNTIRALKVEDGKVVDRREFPGGRDFIVSFGEGPDKELYATTIGGELVKFDPGAAAPSPGGVTGPGEPAPNGAASLVELHTQPGRYRFDKAEYHAKAGPVRLQLTNDDGTPHNIGVRGNGVNKMSDFAMDGRHPVSVEVDLEPGTYTLYCAPHDGLGMTAKLVVE